MTNIMNKYPPPLYEIMRDDGEGTGPKRCLDLGCGNGSWIIDFARDFPNCEAVAVDLVPMQSPSMPPNLRSEVDDINLGLEHFYGDFDVVHAYLIGSGIKNYERLIDQISHVLRPGGLIDVMEFDFCLYDSNRRKIAMSMEPLEPPWVPRFIAFVHSAVTNRGGDIDGIGRMESYIRNHPLFEEVTSQDIWMPTRPQGENTPGIVENNLEFLKSATPLLLNSGLSPELFEMLQKNVTQEILDGVIVHWAKLKRVYAQKRHITS
ncbi:hypothetical protein AX14_008020 [Amanita brunnescens Koide BX004]|nr:hypothetical protein AX14_008020 [Amanita brunnescens Koide BX004]